MQIYCRFAFVVVGSDHESMVFFSILFIVSFGVS